MFQRLQWRIALGYILLITVVFLGLGLYLESHLRDQQLAALETQMARQARLVADDVQPQMASGDTGGLDQRAKQLGHDINARVTLIAADGTVLGDTDHDPATMDNHATRPEVQRALQQESGQSQRHSKTLDKDLLYVAVPVESGGQVVGVARVALSVADVNSSLNQLLAVVTAALVVSALLAILLAALLARVTTGSIHALTEASRRLASGVFDQPIRVTGRDEVSQLGTTFNDMAATLASHIRTIEDERERLSAVLGHMADGVVIVDQEEIVQLINPSAGRLLRVDGKWAVGESAGVVLRDHELVSIVREALGRSQGDVGPRVLNLRGAPAMTVHALASPISGEGERGRRVLLMLQDVTDLRRTETVRRDFVANVSHELRTPVAVLKALVETLEDGALHDPEAAPDFLGRMHVEVDRLAQLIEELLELSRIESGQVALRKRSVDLAEVVAQSSERLRPQAERQGVELVVSIVADLPPVEVDPERIQQVVVNLVHNAIKFTPPKGRVTVAVERRAGDLAVSVADTGVGIPPEALGRLFERFYKLDRARSGRGTGLGLAIAKHLVQAHDGKIRASSPGEGQGSTFTFTIPLAVGASVASVPTPR